MLINDILNYARLEAGGVELHLSDITLVDALSEMEALIAPQLRAKGVAYEYRPCPSRLAATSPEPCTATSPCRATRDEVRPSC